MSQLEKYSDDDLITELENRGRINAKHTATITLADFSMKHTMRCQPDLFHCSIHKWLNEAYLDNMGLSPLDPGIYEFEDNNGNITYKQLESHSDDSTKKFMKDRKKGKKS